MRSVRVLGFLLLALGAVAGMVGELDAQTPAPVENVSTLPPRSPQEEQKALHVPPGFEVQLVAADPDIQKPLNIAFDDKGRLWVTDTVEYPYPVEDGRKPRDTVKILSDFGPDGRARKIETFADGLNIPIGLLPLPSSNAALVHSIPNVYLLRDSDGDGKADVKERFYGEIGHRDTHGMTNAFTWGYDGWIYACHGFSNDSQVAGKDKKPIAMNSGNTYRMRADGSHAEYITHGQVNPFGLAFDPLGNLYSCDCHSRPVYQLLRGAYYPSFGKPDDGLGYGPEMVTHDHGSTGIAGISYYTADQYPQSYRGTTFIGNVVTNRINHDKIEWHGASPKGIEQPDFVWSEDNWFRPVDIELGPDGALYVADFYNRIIGHYEVPLTHPGRDRTSGRIWRIVYKGTAKHPAPPLPGPVDRTKSSVDSLILDLASPNLPVRITAANQLVERGGQVAVDKLLGLLKSKLKSSPLIVHSLWVLERLGKLDDPLLLGVVETPNDPTVLVHALLILVDRSSLPPLLETFVLRSMDDASPHVRKAAAEVLGAHADLNHIRPLLSLRQSTAADDTHLLHVARMALRDQFKDKEVWPKLDTLTLNARDRADVADVAVAVPSAEAAAFLLSYIQHDKDSPENVSRYVHHVARHGAKDSIPTLLTFVKAGDRSPGERIGLLRMIQQGSQERGEAAIPEVQRTALGLVQSLLDSKNADEVGQGIGAVRDLQLKDAIPALDKVFARDDLPAPRRAEALSAVVVLDQPVGLARLKAALTDGRLALPLRESAAIALANVERPEARAAVLEALAVAPENLQSTAAAALVRHREGAEALLTAIAAGKASARLLQQRPITIGLENANIPNVADQIKKLLAGLPPADQKLRELLDARRAGFQAAPHDVAAGAKVYETNCAICHQMEGKGARIGPQLDGVGTRGLERLLEDVLDPNRNVDQMFRVTSLALKDGRVVAGLLLRQEGQVVIIADALGKEVRVPQDEIDEKQVVQMSPMPADMARLIPEADFYHLLDYLLSRREEKPVK
ncbi:MAG: c-type cytochrome [Paludisphaera borealis]|uniref:PVC-type heme-binding CxxCH protein n=1 Tax=Paludisphaera borealis TaxID=1387353 RepID=UPI00284DE158|nr:PVC-type heme-binding CxxCH protein [Paludisphaera borealis]MDR3623282.1 c-type cytochrome [Paludisphaera borealis]